MERMLKIKIGLSFSQIADLSIKHVGAETWRGSVRQLLGEI